MPAKQQKRVTSADVAREAGVARSTVSYVLNQTPHQTIPDATRKRVREAAERLHYTPSAAARTLKRGRSDVVLCILRPWPLGSAAGALLAELTTAFERHGLILVTHIAGGDAGGVDKVWNEISPAAVLTYEHIAPATERAMRLAGVRSVVVLLSDARDDSAARLLRPDSRIGTLQAEHLIRAGHARIGYAYPEPAALQDFAEPRVQGVQQACADAALPSPDIRMVAMDAASAASAIEHWRSLPEPVTAVCAYNDELAQALIAGGRLAGIRIPDELAVIGADNIPAASLASPPLTTIAIDHVAEAVRIVEMVTAALEDREPAPLGEAANLFKTIVRESA